MVREENDDAKKSHGENEVTYRFHFNGMENWNQANSAMMSEIGKQDNR